MGRFWNLNGTIGARLTVQLRYKQRLEKEEGDLREYLEEMGVPGRGNSLHKVSKAGVSLGR